MNKKLKILVADDEELSREYMRAVLDCCEVNSLIVTNGEEVIVTLKNESYDLLLIDCSMPVMDGWTAVKTIRAVELNTNKHQQIYALSGSSLPGDDERFAAAGFDGFLFKPLNLSFLQQLISNLQCKYPKSTVSEPKGAVLNREFISNRYGDQPGLLQSLINIYLTKSDELFDKLISAIQNDSAEDCAFHAHKLKGMSANFGDSRLCTLLDSMEIAASEGNTAGFNEQMELISKEFYNFKKELELLR